MTQDEILEMARQTGVLAGYEGEPSLLVIFSKAIMDVEREALLDVVYGYARNLSWNEDFQADILARGTEA